MFTVRNAKTVAMFSKDTF